MPERHDEQAPLRAALSYLVTMATGHDYADAMKIQDAEWLIENALLRPNGSCQSAVEAPSGDQQAEEAPGGVRGAGSASGGVSASLPPTYEGTCPKCKQWKFIGHGPLCTDCWIGSASGAREGGKA